MIAFSFVAAHDSRDPITVYAQERDPVTFAELRSKVQTDDEMQSVYYTTLGGLFTIAHGNTDELTVLRRGNHNYMSAEHLAREALHSVIPAFVPNLQLATNRAPE